MVAKLTVVVDNVAQVAKSIAELAATKVLVGIPSTKNVRDDDSPIGNAALGYIHHFGAPEANIPARPWLDPSGKKTEIIEKLRQTATVALAGNYGSVGRGLAQTGMIAVNAVKQKITEGPFEPLQQSTIDSRRIRSKGSKYRRKATKAGDVTPLIDTGQLRDAVAYVLRGGSNARS